MEAVWDKAKRLISKKVPGHIYEMWIDPILCVDQTRDCIVLSCLNTFSKNRICEKYIETIQAAIAAASGGMLDCVFVVEGKRGKR